MRNSIDKINQRKSILIFCCFLLLCNVFFSQSKTQFKGFVDAGLGVNIDGNPSSFFVGQYDNYVTSQLSDNISFLGEVVFEYDDGWIIDVERVIIKHEFTNALNFQVGKMHNPLGYWNNAYHHGSLLEPTIGRPLAVKFEDEGGILPIHTTGLMIQGNFIGSLKFGYDLMIWNGVGSSPTSDNNKNKAVIAQLRIEPIDDFKLGVSASYDIVSSSTQSLITDSIVGSEMTQTISNAYLVYKKRNLEIICEGYNIQNKLDAGTITNSIGYFAYAGYTIKDKITPYIKYDVVEFEKEDRYFIKDDKQLLSLGIRYETSLMSMVKIEYRYLDSELSGISNNILISYAIGF